jgi:hypothetical protein
MRKTILIGAAAFMFSATTAVAADRIHSTSITVETVNAPESELSSFCKAIMKGDIETVKKLIDLGEDLNKKSLGMTPAIFAARYNKAKILEVLIDKGADLSIRCNKGWTVEKHAQLSNAKAVLAILNSQT